MEFENNKKLEKMLNILPDHFKPFITKHALLADSIPETKKKLKEYHSELLQQLKLNELEANLPRLKKLEAAADNMLILYQSLSNDEKVVIMSAIGYFLDENDINNDIENVFGLDDDIAVMNAAFMALERLDLLIEN